MIPEEMHVSLVRASPLHRIPLIHGARTTDGALKALAARALLPRERWSPPRPPSDPERLLGWCSHVYLSSGLLYPEKVVAFIFAEAVERGDMRVCPWDTGSMVKHHRAHMSPGDLAALIEASSLGAPEWRTWLVHYVATRYADALDWLQGRAPRLADPMRTPGGSVVHHCFEARFPGPVSLDRPALLAVVLPKHAGGALRSHRLRLKGEGVELIEYAVSETPADRVREFVIRALGLGDRE